MVTNSNNVLDFGLDFFLEHFLYEHWSYLVFCQSDENAFDLTTAPDRFYPRDAMLARVIGIATCLSVCLSVRHAPVLRQNE